MLFRSQIGGTAFGFMLPVLAGFIAMAIGDRPALAVGLVGGMMAASGKSGFLGALVAGFLAGYIIVLLRKVCDKLPDALELSLIHIYVYLALDHDLDVMPVINKIDLPSAEPERVKEAVSYTHLDVYKRQQLCSHCFRLMELMQYLSVWKGNRSKIMREMMLA